MGILLVGDTGALIGLKPHEKVANQNKDYLHKISRQIKSVGVCHLKLRYSSQSSLVMYQLNITIPYRLMLFECAIILLRR